MGLLKKLIDTEKTARLENELEKNKINRIFSPIDFFIIL